MITEGDQIMAPSRQIHLNRKLFGSDATEFNSDRSLKDVKLASQKGYHPFGREKTYNPGRLLAKQEFMP